MQLTADFLFALPKAEYVQVLSFKLNFPTTCKCLKMKCVKMLLLRPNVIQQICQDAKLMCQN